MKLFKYVPAERLDILENGYIRFTQSSCLNDPYEMQPFFERFELSPELLEEAKNSPDEFLDKMAEKVYSRLTDEQKPYIDYMRREIFPELREKLLSNTEEVTQQFRKIAPMRLNDLIGVLSLTEKPDNLPMWAHYAQQHKGFVIEFNGTDPFFNQLPDSLPQGDQLFTHLPSQECGYLRKVEYFDERPYHDSVLDLTPTTVLLAKSKQWEYEQEWRVLQLLDKADQIKQTEFGNIHLFLIPPSCIKGVILGYQMSEDDKRKISDIIKGSERYSHVKLYSASLDEKRYVLTPIEI